MSHIDEDEDDEKFIGGSLCQRSDREVWRLEGNVSGV